MGDLLSTTWRRQALRYVIAAVGIASLTATGPLPHAVASDWQWGQSKPTTVFDPTDPSIAGNANVSSFPVPGSSERTVMYSWATNEDEATAEPRTGVKRSTDGGRTFPSAHQTFDTSFHAAARMRGGDLIDVGFIPLRRIDATTVELRVKRSSDNGASWRAMPSRLHLTGGKQWNTTSKWPLRVNANILVDDEGVLYLSYYAALAGDSGHRVEVAVSRDEGTTWERHGTIKQPTTLQYTEAAISWAKPETAGATPEIVAAITEDEKVPAGCPRAPTKLITARSKDLGKTWYGQRALPISYDPGFEIRPDPGIKTEPCRRPAGVHRYGVSPDIELLPNGVMALRFGRPDNWFAISTDNGRTFKHARRTYVNVSSEGAYRGSSGNGSMAVVGDNRVVISGDNCAPSWGCAKPTSNWTVDGAYRVWIKTITVSPTGS